MPHCITEAEPRGQAGTTPGRLATRVKLAAGRRVGWVLARTSAPKAGRMVGQKDTPDTFPGVDERTVGEEHPPSMLLAITGRRRQA